MNDIFERLLTRTVSWQEYFIFSRSERRGLLALMAILLMVAFVRIGLSFYTIPVSVVIRDSDMLTVIPAKEKASAQSAKTDVSGSDTLFMFNPNDLSDEGWQMLGLSPKQTVVIRNYLSKGGRFRKKEDLKKIYGLSPAFYSRIENYIILEQPVKFDTVNKQGMTDLNTADSAQLVKLNGIGPVLARRIIRYRNLLGGFFSTRQLLEVYGMNDTIYNRFAHLIFTDTLHIQRLNVNTADYSILSKHPYISSFQAKAIIRYRQNVAGIKRKDELLLNHLLDPAAYQQVKNYLIE